MVEEVSQKTSTSSSSRRPFCIRSSNANARPCIFLSFRAPRRPFISPHSTLYLASFAPRVRALRYKRRVPLSALSQAENEPGRQAEDQLRCVHPRRFRNISYGCRAFYGKPEAPFTENLTLSRKHRKYYHILLRSA